MTEKSNISSQLGIGSHTVLSADVEKQLVIQYLHEWIMNNNLSSVLELVYNLSIEASKDSPKQIRDYISQVCDTTLEQIKKEELYNESRL
tara:strand:+ start:3194 stop:3463 length:270 start_codon:yes stop_codon:yes gene_type:complete